jgi:tetratricopeptide (TPR) repeat protein
MPLRTLRSLVTHRFKIRDDDTSVDVAATLRSGLSSLTSGQAEIVGHWLGFDLTDSEAVRDLAGNPEFGTIAFGHLTVHLQSLLTRAPVVLLLDDLQWSDPESLDVIGHMVDAFPNAPMLVVCATRPSLFEHRPRWSAGPGDATITIELAPLDDENRRTHVRDLLHRGNEIPAELVELVIDHTRGNPLHAEQLVALLIDNGVILTDRQPWDIDTDHLDRFTPPTSPTGVIRARLDALSPDESTVLRHASMIGRTFWDDTLVAAATATRAGPSTHAEIAATLSKLRQREFVHPHEWSVFTGCHEYAFRHALLQDASDETMPPAERSSVHRAAATWLERHCGDRLGENVGLLAQHLSQAGELDRAADLLHEAGARAGATSALQSALSFYQRSLRCREATGTGHDVAATATRIELAHLLASLGRNDEAAATYGTAESDATRSGSHRLAANAMAGALRTAAARGHWAESERLVERVRPLAERYGGDSLGRFLSGHALLLIDGPHQDLEAARRLTEQALDIWRALADPASELRALNEMALVSSKAGRLSEADRWYEDGLALARRVGDTSGEWMLLQNQAVLAHLEARAGRTDYARVLELYRSSLERRRRLGLPHILILANLAQAQVEAGQLEDGRRNAREALRIGWNRHDPLDWTIALITLAQIALTYDQLDEGLTILGAVLAQRRTPSLEREIDAVLDFHGIDRSTAVKGMTEAASTDLAAIVGQQLRDQS